MIAILATLALSLQPDVAVRLLNPNDVAAQAVLSCEEGVRNVRLEARDIADVEGCTDLQSLLPLIALETSFDGARDWQHAVASNAECGTVPVAVPLFACKSGVGTAYVAPVDGAAYEWTAQGATILEGGATHRVQVQLTDPKTATLTCVIRTTKCTRTATGVIAVREPIVIKDFVVPASANSGQPVTIRWSYEPGREPATQLLSGDAFPTNVTLDAAARSYTFTPGSTGSRNVELHATYARQLVLGAKPVRRRAMGGTPATASECPSARASSKMEVRGCGAAEPSMTVPFDIGAGETFEALVDVEDGQKVEWSVENGSLTPTSPFGERINVTAGATGKLRLSVRIERTPGCFASSSADLDIILPVNQCAVVPTATMTLGSQSCDRVRVTVAFTGTPPFAGEWSDGTPFRTSSRLTTYEFREAGTYGITRFRDASCFGTVQSTAAVEQLRPRAQLAASSTCGTHRLVATFAGVPPFSGFWSDAQPFTTSAHVLERTVTGGGTWSIRVGDAVCSALSESKVVLVSPPPRATIHGYGLCQFLPNQGVMVGIQMTNGTGPYVIEWAHGVVTTNYADYFWQSLPGTTNPVMEYQVTRARAGACEAEVFYPIARVLYRPRPVIAPMNEHNVNCVFEPQRTRLAVPPPEGAQILWSVVGVGGVIQGHDAIEMTFTSGVPGWARVAVKTTYADRFCPAEATGPEWYFSPPVVISNVRFEPSTIKRGGTARLRFEDNKVGFSYYFEVQPDRARDWNQSTYVFTDTIGPGTFVLSMIWNDPCSGDHTGTATLTITE